MIGSSSPFERSTLEGTSSHFERTGASKAGSSSYFECTVASKGGSSSHFERTGPSKARSNSLFVADKLPGWLVGWMGNSHAVTRGVA